MSVVYVTVVEKVQAFAFNLIFPITFTSSAFVRVDTMPGRLRAWSHVNPVTHLSDAYRGLLLGGEVAEPVLWSLLWGRRDSRRVLPAGDAGVPGEGLTGVVGCGHVRNRGLRRRTVGA
jgi:hypothetical protein